MRMFFPYWRQAAGSDALPHQKGHSTCAVSNWMSTISATTPISLAMSQKPLRRIRHFALHCVQEGGAETCVPTGDQMRTAARPEVFIFRRRLWLPELS